MGTFPLSSFHFAVTIPKPRFSKYDLEVLYRPIHLSSRWNFAVGVLDNRKLYHFKVDIGVKRALIEDDEEDAVRFVTYYTNVEESLHAERNIELSTHVEQEKDVSVKRDLHAHIEKTHTADVKRHLYLDIEQHRVTVRDTMNTVEITEIDQTVKRDVTMLQKIADYNSVERNITLEAVKENELFTDREQTHVVDVSRKTIVERLVSVVAINDAEYKIAREKRLTVNIDRENKYVRTNEIVTDVSGDSLTQINHIMSTVIEEEQRYERIKTFITSIEHSSEFDRLCAHYVDIEDGDLSKQKDAQEGSPQDSQQKKDKLIWLIMGRPSWLHQYNWKKTR